jgi:DNA mismatch repair protein MutS2
MRDSLDLLEWPVLFEHLLNECLTPYGVQAWREAPFLPDTDAMRAHQDEVEGLKILLLRYGDVISETGMPDIGPIIKRLAKGGFLNLNDIRGVMRVLNQGGRLIRHFSRNLKSEPQLDMLIGLLDEAAIPAGVLDYLSNFIEPDGEIKDSASPQIAGLRQKLRHQKHALQQKIQNYLTHPDYASALQSTTVTEREGRSVLPVKVEYKSKLPGVIHGASASGSTVFVEPQGLVTINNEMQSLHAELAKEIERILKELSLYLQEHWESLEVLITALGRLDRRLAAARLSRQMDAFPVALCDDEQIIDLKRARHPLLVLNNRLSSNQKPVVANDIRIGLDDTRTLVITGPNTGGKTVLLKTLGLFAMMLQAGLHLPVAEDSRMSYFQPVLADIGDQQSIAQSLSTFSGHIERLKSFIADETDLSRGLVLIDEIAAGTDPAEGAALARAILDELYRKGAITVVTTHLGELKLDAHQHQGFMNASVEFDAETLSPTYRLMLGVPGASNAITIAQKLGLKESVIQRAKASLSAPVRESADLLQELEQKNRQVEEELQKARAFRLAAEESYEKVELEKQRLETEKRQALKQFQLGLKGRIHDLENQVKTLRKELQQGDGQNLDQVGRKLRDAGRKADRIFGDTREQIAPAGHLTIQDLKPGDKVFSRQLEITGEVIALQPASNEVTLQAGIMRLTVPVSDLQRPYEPRQRVKKAPASKSLDRHRPIAATSAGDSVLEEPLDPTLSCDVRGQRTDEALQNVEKFLDEAIMAGYTAVAIIHGMGTGILKKEIRQYLGHSGYVKRFYPAQATQGGDGKTIIELAG